MAAEDQGPWWRLIAMLLLLIIIGMDLVAWQLSGGANISEVLGNFLVGLTLAFTMTSVGLLLVSLAALHRHMRWQEQVIGLTLLSTIGLAITSSIIQSDGQSTIDALDAMRTEGGMILNGMTATLAAVGLVLGLLLALVTGREHAPDPLLEMESTGGDVALLNHDEVTD